MIAQGIRPRVAGNWKTVTGIPRPRSPNSWPYRQGVQAGAGHLRPDRARLRAGTLPKAGPRGPFATKTPVRVAARIATPRKAAPIPGTPAEMPKGCRCKPCHRRAFRKARRPRVRAMWTCGAKAEAAWRRPAGGRILCIGESKNEREERRNAHKSLTRQTRVRPNGAHGTPIRFFPNEPRLGRLARALNVRRSDDGRRGNDAHIRAELRRSAPGRGGGRADVAAPPMADRSTPATAAELKAGPMLRGRWSAAPHLKSPTISLASRKGLISGP